LVEAADDKQLTKLINRYGRIDLILVDELGYVSSAAQRLSSESGYPPPTPGEFHDPTATPAARPIGPDLASWIRPIGPPAQWKIIAAPQLTAFFGERRM
jgi:hypothetical protein